MFAMKPILLATDGSPTAHEAAEVAMTLASDSGRPLVVVTVFDVSSSTIGYGIVPALPDWSDVLAEHAAAVLDDVREAAAARGLETETVMRWGFPADEICALAEERNAELIVIGSHGWGPGEAVPFRKRLRQRAASRSLPRPGCSRIRQGGGGAARGEGRGSGLTRR
jgi:nucleotide-binding universal stress UspA family protein